MRRAWWIGGVAAVALASVGGAVALSKHVGGKKDDKPAEVTLEFTAKEVVAPAMAALLTQIEFSGPLVAPQTATVRAKAGGTLLTDAHEQLLVPDALLQAGLICMRPIDLHSCFNVSS
jgi:membrane fusion protein, multidrug efflux system